MIKYQILENILIGLQSILPANGYLTDIGKNAEYWGDTDQEWNTSGVTFRDVEEEFVEANTLHNRLLTVEVEAIAFAEPLDLMQKGCQLERDLITLFGSDLSLGGKAMIVELAPQAIAKQVETKGKKAVSVLITLAIAYRTDKWVY